MPEKTALERACDRADGAAKLAALIGVSAQVLSNWKARGVPSDRCAAIEQATGVPCEELRPDVAWVRIKDKAWPNPKGRPLIDATAPH